MRRRGIYAPPPGLVDCVPGVSLCLMFFSPTTNKRFCGRRAARSRIIHIPVLTCDVRARAWVSIIRFLLQTFISLRARPLCRKRGPHCTRRRPIDRVPILPIRAISPLALRPISPAPSQHERQVQVRNQNPPQFSVHVNAQADPSQWLTAYA